MKTKEKESPLRDPSAYRQQVRMPAVQVAGLRPDELEAALAFEIEPFSGIPASEAELAFVPVEDPDASVRVFDVAVRRHIARPSGSTQQNRLLRAAVVLGVLALAFAAADGVWLALRRNGLESEVSRRSALDARVQSVRREARAVRQSAADVRNARETTARAQEAAATARASHPEILAEIASACGSKAVLKALASEGPSRLNLTFVAPSVAFASDVLADLSSRAQSRGWRLQSGPLAADTHGKTVTFTCLLERSQP